jgi:hypothetical protein
MNQSVSPGGVLILALLGYLSELKASMDDVDSLLVCLNLDLN